jgi:Ca2+-binding RTX toxin-like protein
MAKGGRGGGGQFSFRGLDGADTGQAAADGEGFYRTETGEIVRGVPGGTAGTPPSGDGGDGATPTHSGNATGGGGGANGNLESPHGGDGGDGAAPSNRSLEGGSGSGGGGGGNGILLASDYTNTVSITGGNGGNGGTGHASPGNRLAGGGGGGEGGGGLVVTSLGVTLINAAGGSIVGGNGGAGGEGLDYNGQSGPDGTPGAGGVGVLGSDLAIINAGLIAGGLSGLSADGVTPQTRADAITFESGTNSLTLHSTSNIIGNVSANGSADALVLGGNANGSFDVSQIGSAAQYSGFETFQKSGTSTWTLTGTGATPWSVDQGTLLVDGSIAGATVLGGVFGGSGSAGAVTVNGGTLTAGTLSTAGNLTTTGVTLAAAGILSVQIGGTTAGTQYDQVDVNGVVGLGGGSLDLAFNNGFTSAKGNSFVILNNDLADAVSGTFTGLVEGSYLTANGRVLSITYHGGDGNDVALVDVGPIASATIRGTNRDNVLQGDRGGFPTNDTIYGGYGDDWLYGHRENDFLSGENGNDHLFGGTGDDRLSGGNGTDWLNGGSGRNVLTGGNGADYFQFGSDATGTSTITDFRLFGDHLKLLDGVTVTGVQLGAQGVDLTLSTGGHVIFQTGAMPDWHILL